MPIIYIYIPTSSDTKIYLGFRVREIYLNYFIVKS